MESRSASSKQDYPGAFVGQDGKWHYPDNGQSEYKPADPPSDRSIAPQKDRRLTATITNTAALPPLPPNHNASSTKTQMPSPSGHAETAGQIAQHQDAAPVAISQSSSLSEAPSTIAHGNQTQFHQPDLVMTGEGHFTVVPTPAPVAAPQTAPPPAQPRHQAEPHHPDPGRSGFGTGGTTGHGNWTGGDHPSSGNIT